MLLVETSVTALEILPAPWLSFVSLPCCFVLALLGQSHAAQVEPREGAALPCGMITMVFGCEQAQKSIN